MWNNKEIAQTLVFLHDPAHGWYIIKREFLNQLDIDISSFSYQHDDLVYIEEDSDAFKMFQALKSEGQSMKELLESLTIPEIYTPHFKGRDTYERYAAS